MKYKFVIFCALFLSLFVPALLSAQVIYFNSFESSKDTAGWRGYLELRNDAPPDGGNRSVYISGGCVWPHAWIELGPFNVDGFYILRCWGKDLQIGGTILINIDGDFSNQVNISINQKTWKFYESNNKLFCPANKKIILSLAAGGIVASAMLIDKIEIVKVKEVSPWFIRNTGTFEKLKGAAMLNSSTAIVVGDEGSILKTTDYGFTWSNTAPPVNCNPASANCLLEWNSVSFYDSLNGIVVGDNVVTTTDGGEEWEFHPVSENKKFLCADYISPNYIYLGDDSGNVYFSVDTGKTWTAEKLADDPVKSVFYYAAPYMSWRPVYALTSRSVYSTKSSTFDGWKEEQLPITTWGAAVKGNNFKWGDPAFIVGYDGQLAVTPVILRKTYTDSSWVKYTFPQYNSILPFWGGLNDVSVPSSNIAFACGDNGTIMNTSDKGESWSLQKTGITVKLNAIDFYDETKGIAVGDSGTVIIYRGFTKENSAPLPFHLLSPENEDTIWSLPKSIIFTWYKAIDSNNDVIDYSLLISADTGSSWNSFGPVTETTIQINWPNEIPVVEKYFWTVIANDGSLATPSLDVFSFTVKTLADVNKNEDKPVNFVLRQNYPNPFNPSTTISYEIPINGNVEIRIFDAMGKEVATLLNKYQSAGRYKVEWNAGNFASGVYFCSIKSGHFYNTKKLVLIK